MVFYTSAILSDTGGGLLSPSAQQMRVEHVRSQLALSLAEKIAETVPIRVSKCECPSGDLYEIRVSVTVVD